MNIIILPKYRAEKFEPANRTIMISVVDPEEPTPNIQFENKFVDIFYLKFHDTDSRYSDNYQALSESTALEILVFVKKYVDIIDTIVVHCMAGISRSAGIAAALSDILGMGSQHIFNGPYIPNRHVYRMILNTNFEHGVFNSKI